VKASAGQVGKPLRFGAVLVHTGDAIVADIDGVISIPAAEHANILAASRSRAAAEQGYLERLKSGALTLDIYSLRARLPGAGS
jgi:4-hydroxy-4-methyl-2-oxoglutarate aldolase